MVIAANHTAYSAGRRSSRRRSERRIVGLIPAAGRATRLGDIPCSKELLPIGFQVGSTGTDAQPKPVSQYLVEQMKLAGCAQLFFILRSGKWDIADYYGSGARFGLDIGYLMMGEPWGPPFTLNQATPFLGGATVVLGFPDILIHPRDAFAQAVARLHTIEADAVLATFPARADDCCDLAQVDPRGRVVRLIPKEKNPDWSSCRTTWMFAVWGPSFTAFLRQEIQRLGAIARTRRNSEAHRREPEWPVGAVIASAIRAGFSVDSIHFEDGAFLDIGTPSRLIDAARFPGVWNGRES